MGYEIGYSLLGTTCISFSTRAHGIIVNYFRVEYTKNSSENILVMYVSNALFKYEKASEDQAKHVSNILSADQSSNRNLEREIKNESPMNDKAEEKRVEKNFSIFVYLKFSDCEVNVFVNGLK